MVGNRGDRINNHDVEVGLQVKLRPGKIELTISHHTAYSKSIVL
jgi:hypothetical protein